MDYWLDTCQPMPDRQNLTDYILNHYKLLW